MAFDKHTGSVLWESQSDEAGYSSAVFTDVGGIPEAIFFTGERALGVDVRNGKLLWEYGDVANGTANVATPIVHDRYVFLSSDYGTGCVLLELTARKDRILAEEVYFHRNMRNHPQQLGAGRRLPIRFFRFHLDGASFQGRQGFLEAPQRRKGFPGLRRRPPVLLQRKGSDGLGGS